MSDDNSVPVPDKASCESRVRAARYMAARKFPYYSSGIWSMHLVCTDQVPTMGVDAGWRCYWNPAAVAQWSTAEVAGVLIHELSHLIRDHHTRAVQRGVPDNGTQEIWNVAADFEINDDCCGRGAGGPTLPGDALLPQNFGFPVNKLTEHYYTQLVKQAQQQSKQNGQGQPQQGGQGQSDSQGEQGQPQQGQEGGQGQPSGEGNEGEAEGGLPQAGYGGSCADGVRRPYELPSEDKSAPAKTEGQAKLIRRRVAQDVRAAAKQAGNVPAGLERWAEELLAPPKVNWQRQLSAAVRSAVAQKRGMVDYTYRRMSRRQHLQDEIILPGMVAPVPNVAVNIDTSGSMSGADLKECLSEVRGVIRALGQSVDVVSCDTEAAVSKKILQPRNALLHGGGGTDMGVGIRAAMRLRPRPDIIITLTDGYTPWPATPPKARHICVIVGSTGVPGPPFGKTIHTGE